MSSLSKGFSFQSFIAYAAVLVGMGIPQAMTAEPRRVPTVRLRPKTEVPRNTNVVMKPFVPASVPSRPRTSAPSPLLASFPGPLVVLAHAAAPFKPSPALGYASVRLFADSVTFPTNADSLFSAFSFLSPVSAARTDDALFLKSLWSPKSDAWLFGLTDLRARYEVTNTAGSGPSIFVSVNTDIIQPTILKEDHPFFYLPTPAVHSNFTSNLAINLAWHNFSAAFGVWTYTGVGSFINASLGYAIEEKEFRLIAKVLFSRNVFTDQAATNAVLEFTHAVPGLADMKVHAGFDLYAQRGAGGHGDFSLGLEGNAASNALAYSVSFVEQVPSKPRIEAAATLRF